MKQSVFTADCPECHETCLWCSGYRWQVREYGCMTMYPRKGKCKKAEVEKGQSCGTCGGVRKVSVTQTMARLTEAR